MSASTATTMNITRRRRDEFDTLSFLENVINPVTGGGGAMRTISIMSPITPEGRTFPKRVIHDDKLSN